MYGLPFAIVEDAIEDEETGIRILEVGTLVDPESAKWQRFP